jgi:ERCC4-type nuclease
MIISDRVNNLSSSRYKFKRYEFPDGFKLLIDTREQQPLFKKLSYSNPKHFTFSTLKDGDYSIKGFESSFAIERKKASDFYSYISSERSVRHKNNKKRVDRTKRKLLRLSEFEFAALVIDADYSEILSPQVYCNVSPEVARQFLASIQVRYGIHVFIHRRKDYLERWILDRAIKFYNVKREVAGHG